MITTIMICCVLLVFIELAMFGEVNKIRIAVEKKNNGSDLIDSLNKLTEWSKTVKR